MCRNIKVLRREDGEPTDEELRDAALQYIRKLSGYRKPSRVNEAAFERAIDEVTEATRRMFGELVVRPTPRKPEVAPEPRVGPRPNPEPGVARVSAGPGPEPSLSPRSESGSDSGA